MKIHILFQQKKNTELHMILLLLLLLLLLVFVAQSSVGLLLLIDLRENWLHSVFYLDCKCCLVFACFQHLWSLQLVELSFVVHRNSTKPRQCMHTHTQKVINAPAKLQSHIYLIICIYMWKWCNKICFKQISTTHTQLDQCISK